MLFHVATKFEILSNIENVHVFLRQLELICMSNNPSRHSILEVRPFLSTKIVFYAETKLYPYTH